MGGIRANDTYPADFLRDNLQIQTAVIHAAWAHSTRKRLFLGSSGIYPKLAPQPIRELAEMVARVVGYEGRLGWDTSKPDGTPRKLLDVGRLRALGWQPTIPLEAGLRTTYEWFLANQGRLRGS